MTPVTVTCIRKYNTTKTLICVDDKLYLTEKHNNDVSKLKFKTELEVLCLTR